MFLNAIMLAGISAAVLPIVLHLLNRARYRRVEWGAMLFLEDTAVRQLNRSKLAQWLLLALRVLAIAMIALALARPVTRRAFGPADAQRLATVLVIDASPSTTHPEQNTTRFELIRRAAASVLGELRRGDQVGLVVLGRPSGDDAPLTTDLQEIATKLASITPGALRADMADGEARALAMLEPAGSVPREIYLIGDRQTLTWQGAANLPDRPGLRVSAIAVGTTENANVAIESIDLLDPPAIAGMQADVQVRVRNFGTIPRSDLPLTIAIGDKSLDQSPIYLSPGATQTVRRRVTLPRPGSAVLTALIPASGQTADDSAMLAIDVVEPMRVTIITTESPAQASRVPSPDFSSEADYLAVALRPLQYAKQKGDDAFKLRIVSAEQWPEIDSKKDRVVVLAGAVPPDERRCRALEQFVFAGGGVLIAPSARTDPSDWNQWLWRSGDGVAPASVESIQSPSGDDVVRLVGVGSTHPIFSFFAGRFDPLPPTSVQRWLRFSPRPADGVLATLQSGDPFLIAKSYGRGRALALAVPLNADWADFAWSNLYLPTMQSAVRWLGSARIADRNIAAGASIEAVFDAPKERFANLHRPDGKSERVNMSMSGGAGSLVYTNTDLPGRYIVRNGGSESLDFVVRAPPEESDLALLDDDKLSALFKTNGRSIDLISDQSIAGGKVVGASRRSTELSIGLLVIAVAILGAELLVAQTLITPPKNDPAPAIEEAA